MILYLRMHEERQRNSILAAVLAQNFTAADFHTLWVESCQIRSKRDDFACEVWFESIQLMC